MNRKKLTILHSNDMHGDFVAEAQGAEGHLIGGLSLLSGYLNQTRSTEPNVLYVIAGDMVQGSLIDSEFKGLSTIELMNYLAPDVVTLGNHELDYGLPHLLFLERVANFPIVNANLYIRKYYKRLMQPYAVLNIDGLDIMFIGIITEAVLQALKSDQQIASFISLEDASAEVGRICNAYKDEDIDLTVLLTHIGFESDKQLAALLNPDWGVDLIIGGHSHTVLEQPVEINGVLIAQAGVGTDQVGRFDLVVDDDTNSIVEWRWQLLSVDSRIAQPDPELQTFVDSFASIVDRKYSALLCRLDRKLTHPTRTVETELGNLLADIFAQRAGADVMLLGSGAIRQKELGPVVTLGSLRTVFPYEDALYKLTITGEQLTRIFRHIMRPDNRTGEGECFQVSSGVRAVYDDMAKELESLTIGGSLVVPGNLYTIGLQGFHYRNSSANVGLSADELISARPGRVVTTSSREVLEEYLGSHQHLSSAVEGRLVYRNA